MVNLALNDIFVENLIHGDSSFGSEIDDLEFSMT